MLAREQRLRKCAMRFPETRIGNLAKPSSPIKKGPSCDGPEYPDAGVLAYIPMTPTMNGIQAAMISTRAIEGTTPVLNMSPKV